MVNQPMEKQAVSARDAGRLALAEVMTMNEEIKRVVRISREVDMAALNAILMARQADGGGAGFRVVSAELRSFGGRLGQDMAELGTLIHELTGRAATLRKHERKLGLFERTAALGGSRGALSVVLGQKRKEIGSALAAISADKHGLGLRVKRATRLCDTGRTLSRNAAVEASYAGSMAKTLTQVSSQARSAVDEIITILAPMRARLEVRA